MTYVDISIIYILLSLYPINKCSLIYQISPIFFYQCREPSLVSCLPSPVSCLLSLVSCLLSPVFCLRSLVSCLLSPVSCLLSLVSCLLSPVSRLLSYVPYLLSHVSHAVSAADLIHNDIADLAILWSKFADLGNLAILTLLADLADRKQFF